MASLVEILLDLESESENEEIFSLYSLSQKRKKRRNAYLNARNIRGEFLLTEEVPDNLFTGWFRLNKTQLEEIHELLKNDITGRECNAQQPIRSKEKLAVCLR